NKGVSGVIVGNVADLISNTASKPAKEKKKEAVASEEN
ncbi:MAG: hypothetical protein ACI9GO_000723, partial [Bacteroidia bacterium]